MMRNSTERWGSLSMAFHWLTLLLIAGLMLAGFFRGVPEDISTRATIMQMHKSFGITVLALTVLRIVWRHMGPVPPMPDNIKPYETALAKLAHVGLYVLLFAMPIVGWLVISTSTRGIPTEVFGLFTLPSIASPDEAMHKVWEEVHEILAWVMLALIAIHAAGAIKHHHVLKDDVLTRMLPKKGD